MELASYGDNFVPVIPVDQIEHTEGCPFCYDGSCPCHENQEAIQTLNQQYQDGLASRDDVDNIYRGYVV